VLKIEFFDSDDDVLGAHTASATVGDYLEVTNTVAVPDGAETAALSLLVGDASEPEVSVGAGLEFIDDDSDEPSPIAAASAGESCADEVDTWLDPGCRQSNVCPPGEVVGMECYAAGPCNIICVCFCIDGFSPDLPNDGGLW